MWARMYFVKHKLYPVSPLLKTLQWFPITLRVTPNWIPVTSVPPLILILPISPGAPVTALPASSFTVVLGFHLCICCFLCLESACYISWSEWLFTSELRYYLPREALPDGVVWNNALPLSLLQASFSSYSFHHLKLYVFWFICCISQWTGHSRGT